MSKKRKCPKCTKLMDVVQEQMASGVIACNHCGSKFKIRKPTQPAPSTLPPASQTPRGLAPPSRNAAPVRAKRATPKSSSGNKTLLIVGAIVASILLLGGLAAAMFFFMSGADDGSNSLAKNDSKLNNAAAATNAAISDSPVATIDTTSGCAIVDSPSGAFKESTETLAPTFAQFKADAASSTGDSNPRAFEDSAGDDSAASWKIEADPKDDLVTIPIKPIEIERTEAREYAERGGTFLLARKASNARIRRSRMVNEPREPESVYDLTTGEEVGKFSGHITEGSLSFDGQYYVCPASETRAKILVWKRDQLEAPDSSIEGFGTSDPILWTGLTKSGKVMALQAGSSKRILYLFELSTGELLKSIDLPFASNKKSKPNVSQSGSGKLIVINYQQQLAVISTEQGSLLRSISFEDSVADTAFSDDGKILIAAGTRISTWSAETGEALKSFSLPKEHQISRGHAGISTFEDNRFVAMRGNIYDTVTSEAVANYEGGATWLNSSTPITAVSQRGNVVVRGNPDALAKVNQLASASATLEVTPKMSLQVESTKPDPPSSWKAMRLGTRKAVKLSEELQAPLPRFWHSKFGLSISQRNGELSFVRIDLETGKSVSEPQIFARLASNSQQLVQSMNAAQLAISIDGQLVAAADASNENKELSVYDSAGKKLVNFKPQQTGKPIQWMGFDAKGNLLTVCDKRLTSWSLSEKKPRYQIEGGYRGVVTAIAGTDFIVVSAGDYCDIVNVQTGKCATRHYAAPGKRIVDIVIDPTFQRLVTVSIPVKPNRAVKKLSDDPRIAKQQRRITERDRLREKAREERNSVFGSNEYVECTIVVRDLETGKATSLVRECKSPRLCFAGDKYLVVAGPGLLFYENKLDARQIHSSSSSGRTAVGPYDLLWSDERGKGFCEYNFSGFPETHQLPNAKIVDIKKIPIVVRVSGFADEMNLKFAANVAREMEKQGHAIGTGGIQLTVDADVISTRPRLGTNLSNDPANPGRPTVSIPEVTYSWSLTNQDDVQLAQQTTGAGFMEKQSKFYKGRKGKLETYEFDGNPYTDILWEAIEKNRGLKLDFLPPLLVVAGKQVEALRVSKHAH